MPKSTKQNGPGGKGRGQSAADGAIRESVKIEVEAALERFAKSLTETEFDFPPGFSSAERAHIHKVCKSLGLQSKSYGKGDGRNLRVSHRSAAASEAADVVRIAPAVVEVLAKVARDAPSGKDAGQRRMPPAATDGRAKQSFATSVGRLTPLVPPPPARPADLAEFRRKLPVWEKQSEVVQLMSSHQVVLVCGGTGCGKTTQVPQFILDEASRRGDAVQVVCTQPRRISAISVAGRVAEERGEDVGATVGYCIKLDKCMGKETALTFCTSGVLLRALMADDDLRLLTHIIVDEIHERDRFCDFLLISLRHLLRRRPDLRLVLMSATMNTELFVRYFNNCPVMHVEGRTFPVTPIFLGDVLFHTGHSTMRMREILANTGRSRVAQDNDARLDLVVTQLAASAAELGSNGTQQQQQQKDDPSSAVAGNAPRTEPDDDDDDGDDIIIVDYDADPDDSDDDADADADHDYVIRNADADSGGDFGEHVVQQDRWREDVSPSANAAGAGREVDAATASAQRPGLSSSELCERERLLRAYQESFNDDFVDTTLVVTLVLKLVAEGEEGAILVFLPGYDDIANIADQLRHCPQSPRMDIIMLHSLLHQNEQRRVFQKSPPGKRKVVLSTNVAETSITIDDVVFVIDSCKVKEKSYDSAAAVSTLQTTWVSQASALQRRGRAGRCQDGVCYHLMSASRFERLAPHQTPEILRIHLQELCLHTKILKPSSLSIVEFLGEAPAPPPVPVLQRAVRGLLDIGALDEREELTPLGDHLSRLTLEPRLGKMVLYSVLFQCVDPIIVIACCLSYRDPFLLPRKGDGEKANAPRLRFAANYASDHLVLYAAFQEWLRKGGGKGYTGDRWCNQNGISPPVFGTILGMRNQILGQLREAGFINSRNEGQIDANADKTAVIKAVLCAGLYPSLARRNPLNGKLMTPLETKVRIHASSVLAHSETTAQGRGQSAAVATEADAAAGVDEWVAYEELVRTGQNVSVKCCSMVSPLTVMFMAGNYGASAATAAASSSVGQRVAPCISLGSTTTTAAAAATISTASAAASPRQPETPGAPGDGGVRPDGELQSAEDADPAVARTATLDIDAWISFRLESEFLTCLTIARQRLSKAFDRLLSSPQSRRLNHDLELIRTIVTALCVDCDSKSPSLARGHGSRSAQTRPRGGQRGGNDQYRGYEQRGGHDYYGDQGRGHDRHGDQGRSTSNWRAAPPPQQQRQQRPDAGPGGSSPGPRSGPGPSTRGRGRGQRPSSRPEEAAAAGSGGGTPSRPARGRGGGRGIGRGASPGGAGPPSSRSSRGLRLATVGGGDGRAAHQATNSPSAQSAADQPEQWRGTGPAPARAQRAGAARCDASGGAPQQSSSASSTTAAAAFQPPAGPARRKPPPSSGVRLAANFNKNPVPR